MALGFATAENFYYLTLIDGWEAVGRAIASPIVHCMFASIWGYACSRAHVRGRPLLPAAAAGIAIAALAHGIYDFGAILDDAWIAALPPAVILCVWLWQIVLIKRLHAEHLRPKKSADAQSHQDR